jgi:formylglycine-generating enzyme required for sulfatase activity
MKISFRFLFLLLFIHTSSAFSNNISITNVTTSGQNVGSDFTLIEFDVSWENSWRTGTGVANWDAAWVFVKYQVGVSNPVFTSVNSSSNTVTVSSTANLRVGMPVVVTSGTGAFAANTVISSITNSTQFVVSATPTTALSNATITCRRIWEHATLNTSVINHTAPAGSAIDLPADGKGVFIYRNGNGAGIFTLTDVKLRWEYGTDGIADDAAIQIQVFAIEMVYIPTSEFTAGSGGAAASEFTLTTINTSNATAGPSGTGSLGGLAGGYPTGQTAPVNASWPNGFSAFYCMKYEASQGQYRDFLNTQTYAQQVNRAVSVTGPAGTAAFSNTNRNGIDIASPGIASSATPAVYACNLDGDANFNESNDGEWIACNYSHWMDCSAYLDWAGLRPMTELEYEKTCRGNQSPVANEYAWGTVNVAGSAYTLSNAGEAAETIASNYSTASNTGNASYNVTDGTIDGPLRVGIFSGHTSNSGRTTAGASLWGVMELSGNLWEQVVSIGSVVGRNFTGANGDGNLTALGHANVLNWPGLISGAVTGAAGSGWRGGDWATALVYHRVSDRTNAAYANNVRNVSLGFRGVRSMP